MGVCLGLLACSKSESAGQGTSASAAESEPETTAAGSVREVSGASPGAASVASQPGATAVEASPNASLAVPSASLAVPSAALAVSSASAVAAERKRKDAKLGPLAKATRLDVLGVRLGMTPKEVSKALAQHGLADGLMFQSFNDDTGVPYGRYLPELPPGTVATLKLEGGALVVKFALPPGKNDAVGVFRTELFEVSNPSKATSRERFLDALRKKYGRPTEQSWERAVGPEAEVADFLEWRAHPRDAQCTREAPTTREGNRDLSSVCDAILSIAVYSKERLVVRTQTTLAASQRQIDNYYESQAHYDALREKRAKENAAQAKTAPQL